MKPKAIEHIRIAPAHQQGIFLRAQCGLAPPGQFGERQGRGPGIELAHAGVGQVVQGGRAGVARLGRQGQKVAQAVHPQRWQIEGGQASCQGGHRLQK